VAYVKKKKYSMLLGLSLDAGRMLPAMLLAKVAWVVPPCTRAAARCAADVCT
jgi:hypothetical protein